MSKNLAAVFAVTVAAAAMPLACGDDESPTDNGRGGSGAGARGGGTAGQSAGGIGGEESGGEKGTSGGASGSNGTGGKSGAGGKAGAAGSVTGGASGVAGESGASGASDGGVGGAPGGGEGGEGFYDESVERAKRICKKIEALNCSDQSMCVETIRLVGFALPHCGPIAERLQICLDTRATIEDFACFSGRPLPIYRVGGGPCDFELTGADSQYC